MAGKELYVILAELYSAAAAQGKQIQRRSLGFNGGWVNSDLKEDVAYYVRQEHYEYRVKPDDPDEIWQIKYDYGAVETCQYSYCTTSKLDIHARGCYYIGKRKFVAVDQNFVK